MDRQKKQSKKKAFKVNVWQTVEEYLEMEKEYVLLQDDFNSPGAMNKGEDIERLELLSKLMIENKLKIADVIIESYKEQVIGAGNKVA
jgi:hypothetical protein|nr:MAG TPA: hypothetical protein [Inoviridae sp.]